MARAPLPSIDPSQDAAALLRRLGFAILALGVPASALLSRRGTVLLVPVGVSLLVLSAVLDGKFRPVRESLVRLSGSVGSVALVLGLIWAAISLVWAPQPSGSA
jgi:hypothetical protein